MSCPICKKETNVTYRPFCSKHCADVDLAKWLKGSYAFPAEEEPDPDELLAAQAQRDNKYH